MIGPIANIITPAILNAGQIDNTAVADDSITTEKVQNSAITDDKIQNGTILGTSIAAGTLGTSLYAAGSVTGAVLGGSAVSTEKLAASAVTASKVAFGTGTDEISTDEVPEGSTNQYFTDARAVDAVEAETALALQNDVTINTDIKIGHHTIQDASYLKTNGIHILTDDAVTDRWSSIVLEEYGSKGFSINNPAIHGQVSGGTVASPAVVGDGVRCLNLVANARFGTSAGALDTIGQIKITTNETQSSTNRGGAISFDVNPTGGGTDVKEIIKLDGGTTVSANIRFDRTGYFDNTRISTGSDAIVFDSPVSMADVFNLEPTDYDNFTATPAKGDIYMMTNDGADTAKNLPVVYNGTAWVYFDGTTVATS